MNNKGFTLIELIIVITILLIIGCVISTIYVSCTHMNRLMDSNIEIKIEKSTTNEPKAITENDDSKWDDSESRY